jgi:PAS domain S-box-containing protein
MPEITPLPAIDELHHLQERVQKLALDKSYLQLIINLMHKIGAAQGLDLMIETLLRNILDVIGGTNIKLYYLVDDGLHYADLLGNQRILDRVDDPLVEQVFTRREPVEYEHDFDATQLLTQEFGKAYTWIYPLIAGTELVGVIKLENLHVAMRALYGELPTLFVFVAAVLKNEIFSHSRLKKAYDHLNEINEELAQEVEERAQTEEELRAARDELEERVTERTAELQTLNKELQRELGERVRAEEALQASTAEIHDLYNRAPCGYHSLDPDGVFIRINDTELQWLGYTREEIIGKKRFTDIITPASLQVFRDKFPRLKAQGWIKDLEFELVRKDGSTLPVLISSTAVYNPDGGFVMSRTAVFDLSGQKKIEATEHLLSSIVQSSDDAIISKDLDGVIISWNKGAEQIYGYTAEEIVGQRITRLIPPEHQPELETIMATLQRGERVEHCTTERVRKDGQRIAVSLTISPVKDATGTVVGAATICRDITPQMRSDAEIRRLNIELEERVTARTHDLEEKRSELLQSQKALMNIVDDLNEKTMELERANAKLRELDQLKSMFIASMSHELRTPLNSIIGFSSILCDEWLGPVNQEQKENLATILRSGKHLLTLINDVIDVSKIEAGKIETRFEQFDLYDLMTEAVQYLAKDINEKGLELQLELLHQPVFTDRRRLLQSSINLLSNALKFTEKGSIRVAIAREAGPPGDAGHPVSATLLITISDSGIGIAAEDIPRLFQPFVRLDSPIKTTVPGTGLGLYLTRKLVGEVLQGDILCTSDVGKGSTFTIRIPERINEKSTGR